MTASAGQSFEAAFAGPIPFAPLDVDSDATRRRFAQTLYGAVPPAPDDIRVTRSQIPGERAERLEIGLTVGSRAFHVDAALWRPANAHKPAPLICGLDFVGPAGILTSDAFPLDPHARVFSRAEYGVEDSRLTDALRGTSAARWPVDMLCDAGFAVIVSCYGSWTPDDQAYWTQSGVHPLVGGNTSAISCWAWGISRLLDVAAQMDDIDGTAMTVAGHSRLGKAALWAAANDERINAVFANQSGCAGAAPTAHGVGETLAQLTKQFPHWLLPDVIETAIDQHQLLALIAPRSVYLAGAKDDLWADPLGSFAALEAAASCWELSVSWPSADEVWQTCGAFHHGPLGFHLRDGPHDLRPDDWEQFLKFMGQT